MKSDYQFSQVKDMFIFDRFFELYFVHNYVLLIMLGGLGILTAYDVYLEKKQLVRLRITIVMIFALSLLEFVEDCYSTLPEPTGWRILYSALCYSLRPAIIMMIIFSIHKKVHWMVVIPALINVMVAFSAFFTNLAFGFTDDNRFNRGTLGYFPHLISGLYLAYLIYLSVKDVKGHIFRENFMVFFIALGALGAALLAGLAHDEVVNPTYAAGILLYYLFVYSHHTKRDALTNLLNRHSMYSDMDRWDSSIRAVISIDLNELKWLNDNYGHAEGDKAIAVVSDSFMKCVSGDERVYRVGGDEFIIFSLNGDPTYLNALVEMLRKKVDSTGYSCAFGLSIGKPVEEMITEADQHMYADKAAIKEKYRREGRVLHLRK